MFLVEYDNGMFINGEDIQWISINEVGTKFTLKGGTESIYTVGASHCEKFLHNIQLLNRGIANIESYWHKQTHNPETTKNR